MQTSIYYSLFYEEMHCMTSKYSIISNTYGAYVYPGLQVFDGLSG